jgi:uncharacterized tellurite resistance protein B-like protein
MHLKHLDLERRRAVLDIVVLGMYVDGHLAAMEDQRIQHLLDLLAMGSDTEQQREYDASVARVREHSDHIESAIEHGVELASLFGDRNERRWVADALKDVLASDGSISEREDTFVQTVCASLEE